MNQARRSTLIWRSIADSYTLFGFLRQTPDVQSAVSKMFSHGDLWLDTTLLLPLFAETLLSPDRRQYSQLLLGARRPASSYMSFQAVIEEIERHMNRALTYAHGGWDFWEGRAPFLYSVFALERTSQRYFCRLARFVPRNSASGGRYRSLSEYGVRRRVTSLQDAVDSTPEAFRREVQEYWREIQEARREGDVAIRLADHDSESYLGVRWKRLAERSLPLGYSTWWISLDRQARIANERIARRINASVEPQLVMSPDFLLHSLTVGPARRALGKPLRAPATGNDGYERPRATSGRAYRTSRQGTRRAQGLAGILGGEESSRRSA